jgi:thiamine kinase-like enzyme
VVLPTDESQFEKVIALVPELAQSAHLAVRVLSGGLTNTSYVVTEAAGQFVVRIGCDNRSVLGIDRAREEAAVRLAEAAGIAPEILLFLQPEGHLVTRYLDDATCPTVAEFTDPPMVARVVEKLREVHSLASIDGRFDPFADIWRWMALVEARGSKQPNRLASLLEQVAEAQDGRCPLTEADMVLCHNDPYHLNFLDDGDLWLIDWEYAGMGDPMYDLAGIAYMLDDRGRDQLLSAYFGAVEPEARQEMEILIPVFVCWNVVWSLVEMDGGVEDFDYLDLAEELLDWLPV